MRAPARPWAAPAAACAPALGPPPPLRGREGARSPRAALRGARAAGVPRVPRVTCAWNFTCAFLCGRIDPKA